MCKPRGGRFIGMHGRNCAQAVSSIPVNVREKMCSKQQWRHTTKTRNRFIRAHVALSRWPCRRKRKSMCRRDGGHYSQLEFIGGFVCPTARKYVTCIAGWATYARSPANI